MDSLTIDFIHQFSFMNMALTMVSSYGSFDAITDRLNMNTNYTNIFTPSDCEHKDKFIQAYPKVYNGSNLLMTFV